MGVLAAGREAARLGGGLRRGRAALGALAGSAVPGGVLLNNYYIGLRCFSGGSGEKYSLWLRMNSCLADSVQPILVGIAVALLAWHSRAWVERKASEMEAEMRLAVMDVERCLRLASTGTAIGDH